MVQTGDIVNNDGTGGESIYGPTFEDENFILKHEVGSLSMANAGRPHTNGSQFCVTTVPCAHLDGSNVVFARVASGLALLEEVQALSGDDCRPAKECTIQSCGELDHLPADGVRCDDGTCDRLPEYPADYHRQDTPIELLSSITDTKTSGNGYFESGRYQMAIRKYNKCIRYLDRVKEMLDQLDSSPEIESGQNVTLTYRLQCHLNLAACHLKLLEYADCIKQCNEVLFHDPRNGKALYRRAQANFTLANYESAIEDLRKAVEISPHNKAVQKLLEEVTLTNKHYTGVQKQRLSKFFREQRQETVVGNPTH
ncbi:peptidyl-prolyl cis-trans isomerase D [Plutella xylostella]|uniref:peptidyl-prolyl cis-trans isomerase D n=1 Tax=Plutella xylostella TaxID=51655 RepID=UPI0020328788|nr:peptidyl-prolyl cis-trans isomerase D [Plutella xylostella]